MKSKKNTERGQVLVLIALAAIGLVGIVGLAIDGSQKFSDQRQAQNAADTAAVAAALAKVNAILAGDSNTPLECPPSAGPFSDVCTELLAAGQQRAADNGYDGSIPSNIVEIYSPPISGPYTGIGNYVQVIITSNVNTTFSRVLGIDQTQNIVQATAFLKDGGNLADGAMIISYDDNPTCPTGPGNGGGSVDISGSSTLNLNGGGILINSQIACGYNAPNCPTINITGGAGIGSAASVDNIDQKDGFCTFTPPYAPPPENLNQEPVNIPDDVYWPDVPPECGTAHPTPTKLGEVMVSGNPQPVEEWLIYPGFYEDFPAPALVANKANIYMASGVYCIDPKMDQDLSWSAVDSSLLNGSTDPAKNKYQVYNPDGVTLYIKAGGGFSLNSNNPTFLDASTDGDYQGYLIILEGTHTSIEDCNITGGADLHINGLIFTPYCDITINGQSTPTAQINAQLIGWDIKITGSAVINFNYDPDNQVVIKSQLGLVR